MGFFELLAEADATVTGTLGQAVTYVPTEGDPVSVTGIFDAAYQLVEAGQPGVSSSAPAVFLLLEELPSDPSDDAATITVNGTDYSIRETRPDGAGGVLLLLHETT